MKKILSLILVALLVFSLAACGSSSEATTTKSKTNVKIKAAKIDDKYKGQFRAGFARANITPTDISVPLTGYGNEAHRLSTGYLTPLYTNIIAVSDEDNNTVIIIQLDLINMSNFSLYDTLINTVSGLTGVPKDNIITNCSHTHSGPAVGKTGMKSIALYDQMFVDTVSNAAVEAMRDRKVTTNMLYSEIETKDCNWVRHYWADDGKGDLRAMGDNHWDVWWSDVQNNPGASIKHITDPDPTLYLVKFKRQEGKDIIMLSMRAHNTMTGSSVKYVMSSDWTGKLCELVEANVENCYAFYCQGNAGNLNPSSRLKTDNYSKDYIEQGNKVAAFAYQALENMTDIGTGKVAARRFTVECPSNRQSIQLLPQANLVSAFWKKSNDTVETKRYAYTLGIVSQYAANGIIASSQRGDTYNMISSVMVIGKLAITFAPGEMFSALGHLLLESTPYEYTIPLSYSGKTYGYIPTSDAYDYGCYETDTCPEGKGSGEMLVEEYVKQLEDIKKNTK